MSKSLELFNISPIFLLQVGVQSYNTYSCSLQGQRRSGTPWVCHSLSSPGWPIYMVSKPEPRMDIGIWCGRDAWHGYCLVIWITSHLRICRSSGNLPDPMQGSLAIFLSKVHNQLSLSCWGVGQYPRSPRHTRWSLYSRDFAHTPR